MSQRCGFFVAGMFFSIPIDSVQEILMKAVVTPVPGAPRGVAGLLNLRGGIVTVVDARTRLGLPPADEPDQCPHILVRDGGERISLRVDKIGDVVSVSESSFEPPPETLRGPARAMIQGAYKLPEQLMLALDLSAVLTFKGDPGELRPAEEKIQ